MMKLILAFQFFRIPAFCSQCVSVSAFQRFSFFSFAFVCSAYFAEKRSGLRMNPKLQAA